MPPAPDRHVAPAMPVQLAVELGRSAVIASLVTGLCVAGEWTGVVEGGLLGAALWLVPMVLLVGSVVHEGTRARTAAVHAGDWLLKLVVIGVTVASLWR